MKQLLVRSSYTGKTSHCVIIEYLSRKLFRKEASYCLSEITWTFTVHSTMQSMIKTILSSFTRSYKCIGAKLYEEYHKYVHWEQCNIFLFTFTWIIKNIFKYISLYWRLVWKSLSKWVLTIGSLQSLFVCSQWKILSGKRGIDGKL